MAEQKTFLDPRSGEAKPVAKTDEGFVIKNLPIFTLGKHKGKNWDEKWAENATSLYEQDANENWFPSIILGHTSEESEKPRVGFLKNIRKKGKKIFADFVFIVKDAFDQFMNQQWPGRSVEILPSGKISAVALLGGTPPHFKKFAGDYFRSSEDGLWLDMEADMDQFADYTEAKWDGSTSRFTIEQLLKAVPRAVAAHARAQAKQENRDVTKADLKLPYKEPNGTINVNGVRAALAAIGGAHGNKPDLPAEVLSAAKTELQNVLNAWKKKQGKMEEFQEKVQSVAEKIQSVKKIQAIDEKRRAISDVYWAGMDLLDQIVKDSNLDSKQKKEAANKIMAELLALLKQAGDAYISKFKNGSPVMGNENENMITVEQANFLADETLKREREKFEEKYVARFKEKFGMTPQEAADLAKKKDQEVEKIRKEAEERAVEAFAEKLANAGVNNAILEDFKTVRKAIPYSDEKLKFSEGEKEEELPVGIYLERFFEKVIQTAKENKLLVPSGEQGKVPKKEDFEEIEKKHKKDLPELSQNEVFDEDSVKLDAAAKEIIARAKEAGRKITYREALHEAREKLGIE